MPAERSVEFRSQSRAIASNGIGESGLSGRRFATALTGAALVLALVLGAALPAKADPRDDLDKATIRAPAKQPLDNPPLTVCARPVDGREGVVNPSADTCPHPEGTKASLAHATEYLRTAGLRPSGRLAPAANTIGLLR